MKKLWEYRERLEYLIPCFYFAVFFVFLQILNDNKEDTFIKSLMFILMLLDFVLFLRAVKRFLRRRYRNLYGKIESGFIAITRYIRSFTKKVSGKLGLRRNLVYIRGKDKIEFAFGEIRRTRAQEEKKRKPVYPKWKDLKNNRERVRYLYVVFLKKCVKHGFRLDKAMTPADISEKVTATPAQQRIFECYNNARYSDESTQVPDSVVNELLNVVKK
jgi:hypothetical protein